MEQGKRVLCNNEVYVVSDRLGRGSFGEVWKATSDSGKEVAVKFLGQQYNSSERVIDRFDSEAGKMAELKHKGVVKVYGKGTVLDDYLDRHCYVMELMDSSLKDKLDEGRRFSLEQVAKILSKVASALNNAYSHGITAHADVHPGNILLDEDLEAKIADFGMMQDDEKQGYASNASAATIDKSLSKMTAAKNKYSANEVLEEGSYAATELSDMYSLGMIGHDLLKRVDKGEDSDWYDHLLYVVNKAASVAPSQRFASMSEFVSQLRQRKVDESSESYDVSSMTGAYQLKQFSSSIRKNPRVAKFAVGAAALLALCIWIPSKACSSGKPSPNNTSQITIVNNEYNNTYYQASAPVQPQINEYNQVFIPPPAEHVTPQAQEPIQQLEQRVELAQEPPMPQRSGSVRQQRQGTEHSQSSRAERRSQSHSDRSSSRSSSRHEQSNPQHSSRPERETHAAQQTPPPPPRIHEPPREVSRTVYVARSNPPQPSIGGMMIHTGGGQVYVTGGGYVTVGGITYSMTP